MVYLEAMVQKWPQRSVKLNDRGFRKSLRNAQLRTSVKDEAYVFRCPPAAKTFDFSNAPYSCVSFAARPDKNSASACVKSILAKRATRSSFAPWSHIPRKCLKTTRQSRASKASVMDFKAKIRIIRRFTGLRRAIKRRLVSIISQSSTKRATSLWPSSARIQPSSPSACARNTSMPRRTKDKYASKPKMSSTDSRPRCRRFILKKTDGFCRAEMSESCLSFFNALNLTMVCCGGCALPAAGPARALQFTASAGTQPAASCG
mmetsp:Transcript_61900/g.144057  ORF Transcript_61900/g.144057 Transcript_61900/m.144057 type:complete len:261 (-) Transcript_61900:421-1203(-)